MSDPEEEKRQRENSVLYAPPPQREEHFAFTDRRFEGVQGIIKLELKQIFEWASENEKDARKDVLKYWSLKLAAIVGGAATPLLHAAGHTAAIGYIGVISAVCIAIDGLYPRGRLFNVHKRAANELRALQDSVATQLNAILALRQGKTKSEVARRLETLFESIEKEKARVARYVTDAEANLGETFTHGRKKA